MLANHSLLPAPVPRLLTKPCLLEALVFGGANQVTGMCSCLLAKAISWSSRSQESGQRSLWGTEGTLRGWGGHYLPTLLWHDAHLQIDACARPGVEREWAISSLGQEALPAEFALCSKGGELSQSPEHPQRGNRATPAFLKPLSILETPLNDQGGVFKAFYPRV